jgi:hypothetical protein
VRDLSPPGLDNHFQRPSFIYADPHFDEVFVGDFGNNRVVIFDAGGAYKFEFGGGDRISTPLDLVVDSEGFVYVLASTPAGKQIVHLDFDGIFLGSLHLPAVLDSIPLDLRHIAIDDANRIYALDAAGQRICVFSRRGAPLLTIPLTADIEPEFARELTFGKPLVKGGRLYVPAPQLGQVQVYALTGERIGVLGHKGNNIGELNFPQAVAVTDEDLVLVLDKHRFNVVCFDLTGRFLGEFGGKGLNPGWFYHPTLLAVDREHRVYIGQIYENKTQICRLPEFIVKRHLYDRSRSAPPETETAPLGTQSRTNHKQLAERRAPIG